MTGSDGYQKTYTYNPLGLVSQTAETLPSPEGSHFSETYVTKTTYDDIGRVLYIQYPTADASKPVVVKHHYDHHILERISDAGDTLTYWKALASDQFGHITQEALGNQIVTSRRYDLMGRLNGINSHLGSLDLQLLNYRFDNVGNLVHRADLQQGLNEDFSYDRLYRLKHTTTQFASSSHDLVKTLLYDGHGNIKQKDGKNYSYGENGAGIHAVTSVNGNSYRYDANGNMLYGGGRSLSWTAFNKPMQILDNRNGKDENLSFGYNDQRSRIYKKGKTATTWYIGGLYERTRITSGNDQGSEIHKYYLNAGGQTVAYISQHKNTAHQFVHQNTRYLLHDHLGSVTVITDENGQDINKLTSGLSYNAWGQRRMPTGAAFVGGQLATLLNNLARDAVKLGFTGHEHDDEVGLINMKGRLYDAVLGRFISADPHVQNATDTQSYNRYTYVKNNPLSYTDPSGYFLRGLFRSIKRFFKKWGRTILAIAVGVFTAGIALAAYAGVYGLSFQATLGVIAAQGGSVFAGTVIAGAAGGFASGLISTGSLRGALEGAVFGGLSAGLAYGIGHGLNGGSLFTTKSGTAVAHGVAQGTVSVLRGGKFKEGFAGGFMGHMAGGTFKGKSIYTRTAFSAVVGGTISKVVGGKFANGAVSAAFTHLFNTEVDVWNRKAQRGKLLEYRKIKGSRIRRGIYNTSEWKTYTIEEAAPPGLKGGWGLVSKGFVQISESQTIITGDIQDFEMYEFETIYDLDNGVKVNEYKIYSTERYIGEFLGMHIGTNVKTSIITRSCYRVIGTTSC